MKERIKELFAQAKLHISDSQAEKLFKYYEILKQENEKYNLTAITEFEDVVKKHFIDSAAGILFFKGRVLDVGSGAGFPGVVLAILNPKLEITLLDSLNKRINFLNLIKKELNLTNIDAKHERIEDFLEKQKFDVVTARAVAEMPTLLEYLLPYVKVGGRVVVYKGSNFFDEIEKSSNALNVLGGQIEEITKFNLFDSFRALIVVRKVKNTPTGFPRGGNLPRKKPL